ncbi:MAG: hypothetical protein O3A06_11395 [Proteobacteria bacterium]|nr:hypothetical protein [Pseudomonadota bacterium]
MQALLRSQVSRQWRTAQPITPKPPVQSLAILMLASLLSLPVVSIRDFRGGFGASYTTLRGIIPEKRCGAVSQLFPIAATIFGWLWPTVAHICHEAKSRIFLPFASQT